MSKSDSARAYWQAEVSNLRKKYTDWDILRMNLDMSAMQIEALLVLKPLRLDVPHVASHF
ncbi:MAG: hypothetical protein DVB28_001850 [Verrucomicrobia bacterium]|nr:MAG: hypothetical protein DVB28_001850 [Verrucomicrobiota bacterium]